MAISESKRYFTESVDLPASSFWRLFYLLDPPKWAHPTIARVETTITPLIDQEFEQEYKAAVVKNGHLPINESLKPNHYAALKATINPSQGLTNSTSHNQGANPRPNDINGFFKEYGGFLSKNPKPAVRLLMNKLAQYEQVQRELKTKQQGVTENLAQLQQKNGFIRWIFRHTEKNLTKELQQIQTQLVELNRNCLTVAGVTAKYLNKNYAALDSHQHTTLVNAIKPTLTEMPADSNTDDTANKTKRYINELLDKIATPKKRVQLACDRMREGLKDKNEELRKNAQELFAKEINELKKLIKENSEAISSTTAIDIHLSVITNFSPDSSFNETGLAAALKFIKDFIKAEHLTELNIEKGASVLAEDIFNYIRACYGLPDNCTSVGSDFWPVLESAIDREQNIETAFSKYYTLTTLIFPNIISNYSKDKDNNYIKEKVQQKIALNEKLAIHPDNIGSGTAEVLFSRIEKSYALLKNFGDDETEDYHKFVREYYRNTMCKLYDNKINGVEDIALNNIVNKICNDQYDAFNLLEEKDKLNINLLISLTGKEGFNLVDEPNILQKIKNLNHYLAENPRKSPENNILNININAPGTSSSSDSEEKDSREIEVLRGNKSKKKSKKKSEEILSSKQKPSNESVQYDCSQFVIEQCEIKIKKLLNEKEFSEEDFNSANKYVKVLFIFDQNKGYKYTDDMLNLLQEKNEEKRYKVSAALSSESKIFGQLSEESKNKQRVYSSGSSSSDDNFDADATNDRSSIDSLLNKLPLLKTQVEEKKFQARMEDIKSSIDQIEGFVKTNYVGNELKEFSVLLSNVADFYKENQNKDLSDDILKIQLRILGWHEYCAINKDNVNKVIGESIVNFILQLPALADNQVNDKINEFKIILNPALKDHYSKFPPAIVQIKEYLTSNANEILVDFETKIADNSYQDFDVRTSMIKEMDSLWKLMQQYEKYCEKEGNFVGGWFNKIVSKFHDIKDSLDNFDNTPDLQAVIVRHYISDYGPGVTLKIEKTNDRWVIHHQEYELGNDLCKVNLLEQVLNKEIILEDLIDACLIKDNQAFKNHSSYQHLVKFHGSKLPASNFLRCLMLLRAVRNQEDNGNCKVKCEETKLEDFYGYKTDNSWFFTMKNTAIAEQDVNDWLTANSSTIPIKQKVQSVTVDASQMDNNENQKSSAGARHF